MCQILNNEEITIYGQGIQTRAFSYIDDILELTNLAENYSVFELIENYLTKDKKKTSKILNENNYNNDDCILIIRTFINRHTSSIFFLVLLIFR